MQRRLFLIIPLWICYLFAYSENNQTDSNPYFFSLQSHAGGVQAHSSKLLGYTHGLSPALEVHAGIQTRGKNKWEHLYNFPAVGMGYYRGYPGQTETLGTVNSGFMFIEFPSIERKNFSTRMKLSLGLAHFSKQHHPVDNPENHAISTPFNVHFNINYKLLYPISQNRQLTSGVSFSHFSNGAFKKPNKGLNLFDFNIGIRQLIGEQQPRLYQKDTYSQELQKHPRYSFEFIYAVGKMQKTIEPDFYGVRSLSLNVSRQSNFTRSWGLGLDVFYDDFIKTEAINQKDADTFKEYLHGAVHLSHELIFNNLSAIFNLGYYVFYYVEPYKPIFQRVGLRYQLPGGILTSITLKTHYARADFVEWGIGYRLF